MVGALLAPTSTIDSCRRLAVVVRFILLEVSLDRLAGVTYVKIMLDCSPRKIAEYTARHNYEFWQLRTPLTNYARAPGIPYGLENGCFVEFNEPAWLRLVAQAELDPPVFVTLPDIVGDAARTIELFHEFKSLVIARRALVLQDGIRRSSIPWAELDAVFIGGSDEFKFGREAMNAAKTAKLLKRWVHVGRVNTASRVRNWRGLADSIDGSGISRFDHMLEEVLLEISEQHPQLQLIPEPNSRMP